jgi:hypothetical protein
MVGAESGLRASKLKPASLALAFALIGCGGSSSNGHPATDSGLPDAADASPSDAATDATPPGSDGSVDGSDVAEDASTDTADAKGGANAAIDGGSEAGRACSASGPIAIAGNYAAADGTQYWVRKTATAATFTVVPPATDAGDASAPISLPRLSRIKRVCPQWLGLAATDGSFARLDWESTSGGLQVCIRSTASLDTATGLAATDPSNGSTGCNGNPWIALAPVSP